MSKEDALSKSEEQHRFSTAARPQQVWTATADGVLVVDLNGDIVTYNQKFIEMWGIPADFVEQITSTAAVDHILPQLSNPDEFTKVTEKLNAQPESKGYDLLKFKDGRIYERHSQPQMSENSLVGRVLSFRDITERERAERKLRESEEQMRSILDGSRDGIIVEDNGKIIYINNSYAQLLGYGEAEELVGKHISDILPDDDAERMTEYGRQRLRDEEAPSIYEFKGKRKDGVLIEVEGAVSTSIIGGKKYIMTAIRDVTERKRAAAALLESQQMLQLVMDNVPQAVFWKDRNSVYLGCNQVLARRLGFNSPAETIGKTDYDFPFKKAEADFYRECDRRVMETGIPEYHIEEVQSLNGGDEAWLDTNKVPLRDADGAVIGILGTFEDVTYRKQAEIERQNLEAQLRQAQKMESIGTLAGGVAHDFNNLLTIINGNIQLARIKCDDRKTLERRLEEIEKAANRAAALTRQLLAFSRRQQLQRNIVNLNDVVSDILKMLGRIIGEHIEINIHPATNLSTIYADAGQIEQVVMNLAINARDSMPDGGRLIIETHNVTFGDEYQRSHTYVKPGRYAQILISDTGTGMTKEVRQRIFEPFFTTKDVGKGTGLGLSMVYGIVRQHEGHIEVYSEPGHGTTFKIHFPVEEKIAGVASIEETAPSRGGTETILVAEDEEALRELIRDILEQLGYRVILAKDGMESVELVSQLENQIDLVMLDLVMPRLSGSRAYEQISAAVGEMPVIFMTGYSDKMLDEQVVRNVSRAFLQKPYSIETLSRKVREVLDAHKSQISKN